MLHIIIYVVMTDFFLFWGKSHLKDEDRLFCKNIIFLFDRKPLYNKEKEVTSKRRIFVCFL